MNLMSVSVSPLRRPSSTLSCSSRALERTPSSEDDDDEADQVRAATAATMTNVFA